MGARRRSTALDRIDVDLVELFVTEDLAIAGKKLRQVPELDRALVAAIVRGPGS